MVIPATYSAMHSAIPLASENLPPVPVYSAPSRQHLWRAGLLLTLLGWAALSCAEAEPGLVGHWKLDETSGVNAADASGNGNTGKLANTSGTVWVAGKVGGAILLDGVNDIITVPDSSSLDLTNTFTLAAWINPASYSNGRILRKGSTAGQRYDLALSSSGLALRTSTVYTSPSGLIQLNAWQHVAVTYDGTTLRIFVQGVEKVSTPIALSVNPNTAALTIGNIPALNSPFKGMLDDVRIYNRALAAGEIQVLAGTQAPASALAFSTYLGGSRWDYARDICADAAGNVYVAGATASSNFPTTPGAYSRIYNAGVSTAGPGTGSSGNADGFVAKFNASGQLVWSTYLGGAAYDRIYNIAVDAQGYVYVAGRAGPGFPVTAGAFQTTFAGYYDPAYGSQNGFVAKLSPDGSSLIWASYVGVGQMVRGFAIDDAGDIYAALCRVPASSTTMPAAFANAFTNAFRKTPGAGSECGLVKIQGDGTRVLWATWLGGSGNDSEVASIRVDALKRPYFLFSTNSTDVQTAGAAAKTTLAGGNDMFVGALNATGSALVFGTYLGGTGNEGLETHGLAIDASGNAYVAAFTASADWPVTPGTVGTTRKGTNDFGIAKIGLDGGRLLSTFVGGTGTESPDGISVDAAGRIFVTGLTSSTDFPVTAGTAPQPSRAGANDAVMFVLSADMTKIEFGTYLGGTANDVGRAACLGRDGAFYLAGCSDGSGWPTLHPYQATFAGTSKPGTGLGDVVIVKLVETGDRDGDGKTGLEEFIAGTDPLNPADVFNVQGVSNNGAPFQTTFLGHKGRYYILKRSLDGVSNWTEVVRTTTLTGDSTVTLGDTNPPAPKCYFRVDVVMP